jgi:hypothetical protein
LGFVSELFNSNPYLVWFKFCDSNTKTFHRELFNFLLKLCNSNAYKDFPSGVIQLPCTIYVWVVKPSSTSFRGCSTLVLDLFLWCCLTFVTICWHSKCNKVCLVIILHYLINHAIKVLPRYITTYLLQVIYDLPTRLHFHSPIHLHTQLSIYHMCTCVSCIT